VFCVSENNSYVTTETGQLSRYSDGLDGRGSIPGRDKIVLFSTASVAFGLTQTPVQ
jgi:hypothetical protein